MAGSWRRRTGRFRSAAVREANGAAGRACCMLGCAGVVANGASESGSRSEAVR